MYLRGSKWHMKRRRRQQRSNPLFVALLLGSIGLVLYFNQYVIAEIPAIQPSTPTPTRDPEAIITEAEDFMDQGSLFPAINAYQQAILAAPQDPNIHVDLARAQILAGQYEAAETSAQNALLLNPQNPRALATYGWALIFLGKDIEAEQVLLSAIELDPNNAEAYAFYAELLADQEYYEDAADMSRKAMELAPNTLEVRRARAYVLEVTGNYEDALIEYNAALVLNNRIADVHLGIGRTYRALGLNNEAIDAFTQADALNPGDPLPDVYISRIYLNTGEYAKAIQFAKRAVDDDPTNPYRYGSWGVALYRNLQYVEAIEAFQLAIQGGLSEDGQSVLGLPLDYDIAEYYYMYALALARSNQCSEAIPIAQLLLAGVPADEIAVFNAQETIRICQESIGTIPTATPDVDVTPDVEVTETPEE